jgi:hypothetical protein
MSVEWIEGGVDGTMWWVCTYADGTARYATNCFHRDIDSGDCHGIFQDPENDQWYVARYAVENHPNPDIIHHAPILGGPYPSAEAAMAMYRFL